MTAISQLDDILNLFDYNDDLHGLNGMDIYKKLKKKNIEFEINKQNEILLHLVEDKKLRVVEKYYTEYGTTQLIPYYLLTFEGGLLQDNGGYSTSYCEKERQRQFERMRDNLLIKGSWGAAIGALTLCVIEALKYWKWALTIEALTLCIVLGLGIIIGVILKKLLQGK